MKLGRLWLAVVIVLFCLPLFIGLGNDDVRGDESIYSWGVDGILETGEWLLPRSSPWLDAPFYEKPPLKFWIVAAGIKAGLPHNEFGLRFWDALFGGAALLYIFAIGRRLGGSICGAMAALATFVHQPILYEHGFRSNNMEAGLVLSYCGAMFHYMKWASAETARSRRWLHATAVMVFFSFGFLLKFVAALFIPMVIGMTVLLVPSHRRLAMGDWKTWVGAHVLALALIAPWFIYCTVQAGSYFWHVIFGSHVYERLTAYVDPSHVHPWNYYFITVYEELKRATILWLVAAGAVFLIADTIRRRWPDGFLVIAWFAVPLVVVSLGTSKLYHYLYPFLPPLGLFAGYAVSGLWVVVRPPLERAMRSVGHVVNRIPLWTRWRTPTVAYLLLGLAAVALTVTVWTMINGSFALSANPRAQPRVAIRWNGVTLLRNRELWRPAIAAALLAIAAGWPEWVARGGIAVLMLAILPMVRYRETVARLEVGNHVLRPARDCMVRVGSAPELLTAAGVRGMYVDGRDPDYANPFNHEYAYYFRQVGPWKRSRDTPGDVLYQYLFDPAEQRPVLIGRARYEAFLDAVKARAGQLPRPPYIAVEGEVLLVLPGPYSVCQNPPAGRE